MKRAKPCQHKRRLKSGKVITVNKGRKKSLRKRKVFRGVGLSEATNAKRRGYIEINPEEGNPETLFLSKDPKVAKYFAKRHNTSPYMLVLDMDDKDIDKHFEKKSFDKIISVKDKNLRLPVISNREIKNRKKEDLYNARVYEYYSSDDSPSHFTQPDIDKVIKKEKARAKTQLKNFSSTFFHGTNSEALANMVLSDGLKPVGGKLYLSDNTNYARFRGRQASKNDKDAIIIEVEDPGDLVREGRHFVSKKTIPTRKFKKVHIGDV